METECLSDLRGPRRMMESVKGGSRDGVKVEAKTEGEGVSDFG